MARGVHRVLGTDDTILAPDQEIELRIEDELEEIRSDVREIRQSLGRHASQPERISKRLDVAAQRSSRAHDSVRGLRRRK